MSAPLDSALASPLNQPVHDTERAASLSTRHSNAICATLIAFVASGMLWGNVLFFRISGYPVTLVNLATAILYVYGLTNWFVKGRIRIRSTLLVPALILLLLELAVHGVLGGGIGNVEWVRSYLLLAMCAGLLIVMSDFRIRPHQLPGLAKAVSYMAYLMGGLGMIQFALSNTVRYVWQPLPSWLAVGQVSVENDALRFAGLQRALGISSEFSYYGIGMTVLAAICLALLYLVPPPPQARFFRYGAMLAALGGVVTSVSLAAWGLLGVVLLGWAVSQNVIVVVRQWKVYVASFVIRRWEVLLTGCAVLIGLAIFLWPYLQGRLTNIITSADGSTNYRVKASIDLLISPSDDLSMLLFGTGVGMESQDPKVLETFLKYFSQEYLNWLNSSSSSVSLTNGYTYVAVTMGWIGLALHVWLIMSVFRKRGNRLVPRLPLVLLIVGYPFTNGIYLSPSWWACMVLVAALLSIRMEEHPMIISSDLTSEGQAHLPNTQSV